MEIIFVNNGIQTNLNNFAPEPMCDTSRKTCQADTTDGELRRMVCSLMKWVTFVETSLHFASHVYMFDVTQLVVMDGIPATLACDIVCALDRSVGRNQVDIEIRKVGLPM